MAKHVKYFRAFNGKECWDEPRSRNAGDYVGVHRQSDGEGYLQSEHLEWLLAGKPESFLSCVSHPDIGWGHACVNCRRGDLCVMWVAGDG